MNEGSMKDRDEAVLFFIAAELGLEFLGVERVIARHVDVLHRDAESSELEADEKLMVEIMLAAGAFRGDVIT